MSTDWNLSMIVTELAIQCDQPKLLNVAMLGCAWRVTRLCHCKWSKYSPSSSRCCHWCWESMYGSHWRPHRPWELRLEPELEVRWTMKRAIVLTTTQLTYEKHSSCPSWWCTDEECLTMKSKWITHNQQSSVIISVVAWDSMLKLHPDQK